ncbi:MAG: LytTR family transcriptional regulator DNA-binding domain-containing protein [Bacteroidales bacterium]|nr:LytTR family transcriptional regulator DNA-binding domain-containing protein [Bacteroidales bacterium]
MKPPAFYTIPRMLTFVGIFMMVGALIPLCLTGLIPVKSYILSIQGAISGLLICGISVMLWYTIRFTKFNRSSLLKRIINHLALLSLTLFVLIGTEYLLFYILFSAETFQQLAEIIPFKIVIGILAFIIIIQYDGKQTDIDAVESSSVVGMEEEESIPEAVVSNPETSLKSGRMDLTDNITVKSGSKINIIQISDLLYLQAEGDYVILYTTVARFIKEDTMKHLEEQLPDNFLRIHRSCIVNIGFISRIELYEKQRYMVILRTGQKLKASVSGYKLLKEKLHLS